MLPSERVISANVPVTPEPPVGAAMVDSGGQAVAQLPVQLLTPDASFLKVYRVMPLSSTR